jgi:uncharacterized protein (TIGR01777 family)
VAAAPADGERDGVVLARSRHCALVATGTFNSMTTQDPDETAGPPADEPGAARHIVVSGASGLIGTALIARLAAAGHIVHRLVRRPPLAGEVRWDPAIGELPAAELEGCDTLVHLAGAGIGDRRWNERYKREIRNSRRMSTELLARTIASLDQPPRRWLSGSAIGIYGDRGDEVLDETSTPGDDFLAEVCQEWEDATGPAAAAGVEVINLRTGIVLAANGGALGKQLPLFKFGLGGKFGSGQQWQSWISLDDEVGAIEHLLTADVAGPVNLTAPGPVRNADFARTLATVLHRPSWLTVPSFGPRLLLGREMADALLFSSQRVQPSVLAASGYTFHHPTLDGALRAVLGRPA